MIADTMTTGALVLRRRASRGYAVGECVRSQSRNASFIRVCHPAPVARKAASTSGLYRTATCSFTGRRFGPRVLTMPTGTPFCFITAPFQSATEVRGLSGSAGMIFPVDAFFMLFCLSDGNNVVNVAARGMHHEHDDSSQHPQCLQSQLSVSVAPVFTGDGEALEYRGAVNKVDAVLTNVGLSLGFVVSDHKQIVDAINSAAKQYVDAFRCKPLAQASIGGDE